MPSGRTRHGWFLYAGDAPAASIPADLAALLRHARNRGCEYIALDCDALPLEDLPILHPDFQDERLPSPEPPTPITQEAIQGIYAPIPRAPGPRRPATSR